MEEKTVVSLNRRPYAERMNELQRKLGHPETGVYMQSDYRKLKRLPFILRNIIEEHYGVYWPRGNGRTQASIARDMGIPPANLSVSIREAFELLERIDSLEEERDQAEKKYWEKVPTNLDSRGRRGILMAIRRLEDVLDKDGVIESEEKEE
jgi:hypothetical protein